MFLVTVLQQLRVAYIVYLEEDMTRSGSHRNSLREQLDVYKHAVIWDTRFSSNPRDHGEGEERKQEKMVDEFRREIPGHLR